MFLLFFLGRHGRPGSRECSRRGPWAFPGAAEGGAATAGAVTAVNNCRGLFKAVSGSRTYALYRRFGTREGWAKGESQMRRGRIIFGGMAVLAVLVLSAPAAYAAGGGPATNQGYPKPTKPPAHHHGGNARGSTFRRAPDRLSSAACQPDLGPGNGSRIARGRDAVPRLRTTVRRVARSA